MGEKVTGWGYLMVNLHSETLGEGGYNKHVQR